MIRRAIFIVVVLVGSTAAIAASSAEQVPSVLPPTPPAVHGDTPPVSALPTEEIRYDPGDYAAVAVSRARTDGTSVPAFLVVHEEGRGVTEEAMIDAGLPVVPMDEIEMTSLAELESIAQPSADVDHALTHLAAGEGLDHDHDGISIQTHPTSITDTTSLPVTNYADAAWQDVSDWSTDLSSAFNAARNTLSSEAGVNLYQFYLMTTGTPVHDVSTWCHMDDTAEYEAGFAPHVGSTITVFSTGDISGYWGASMNGPISTQIQDDWSWDNCSSSWRTPRYIPAVYVKHRPLWSLGNMQMLATHEIAHQFTMRHEDASCISAVDHIHKTIEAFTSDSDTPDSCGTNTMVFQHWHWDFTSTTNTRMWNERVKWTGCFNSGC